jgi:hypothetical protein
VQVPFCFDTGAALTVLVGPTGDLLSRWEATVPCELVTVAGEVLSGLKGYIGVEVFGRLVNIPCFVPQIHQEVPILPVNFLGMEGLLARFAFLVSAGGVDVFELAPP